MQSRSKQTLSGHGQDCPLCDPVQLCAAVVFLCPASQPSPLSVPLCRFLCLSLCVFPLSLSLSVCLSLSLSVCLSSSVCLSVPPPPLPTHFFPFLSEGVLARTGVPGTEARGRTDNTYRYTVTTRLTPALRWAAIRAILMFH